MRKIQKIGFLLIAFFLLCSCVCFATDNLSEAEVHDHTHEEVENTEENAMVNSDLYLVGDDIVVNQVVDGNLFVLANKVTVKSVINGTAFIAANSCTIEDTAAINHSLFVVATDLSMSGKAFDVYALANHLTFTENAYVVRDLRLASNEFSLNGAIGRDAFVSAKTISVPENEKTIIYGNFNYSSEQELTIPETMVEGEVNFSKVSVQEPTIGEKITSYVMEGLSVVLYMTVITVLATFFAPKFLNKAAFVVSKKPFATAGIGILATVFIPIVSILIMITGVLAYVGMALLAVYFLVLSMTLAILSMAIAKQISLKIKQTTKGKFILLSIVSALIIWLLQQVPYIGRWISIFTVVFGLGIFVFSFFSKKEIEEPVEDLKQ